MLRHTQEAFEPFAILCDQLASELTAGEIEAHVAGMMPAMRSTAAPPPTPTPMRIGLAQVLESRGRHDEARECWMTALRDAPADARVLAGAANIHALLGDIDEATRIFDRALALHPDNLEVVTLCVEFLVHTGRLSALWDGRIRKPRPPFNRSGAGAALPVRASLGVRFPKLAPYWDGEQPLDGKTVLMECCGGYGDIFQICRFAALFKERGASVILDVPTRVVDLLRSMKTADDVVGVFDPCRPFDYQCRAAFPTFFVEWTPQWMHAITPYIGVEAARRRAWSDRFDRRLLNVGIIWKTTAEACGNLHIFRSVPLDAFRPLAGVPGVTLYGLQVGPGAEEVTADTRSWLVTNLDAETRDFREAAAAIDALDVIVSADAGIAHLAGAIGKTCFVLLPKHASWRWMTAAPDFAANGNASGNGTLWYPSMRVFQQNIAGDWSTPMRQIADNNRSLASATAA